MRNWRDQQVTVEGRGFVLNDVYGETLYHGSPISLEVGKQLLLQSEEKRNFKESPISEVCFTSDKATAIYWARKALNNMKASVYLYEIEPNAEVSVHRTMPANYGKNINLLEGRSATATITKVHVIPEAG